MLLAYQKKDYVLIVMMGRVIFKNYLSLPDQMLNITPFCR